MKLHPIDGPTQVGYAKQRPTVLVVAVCDYLDSLFLSIPYLSSFFPSPPSWNCRKSAETLPHRTVKLQHTLLETVVLVKMPWNFGTEAFPKLTTDRQVPAVLAVGAGRFFLPLYWSLFFRRKYGEKIV